MSKIKKLDLFKIDDRTFEHMVADLLRVSRKLREVQVQPRTTPNFDIIGIEDVYSSLDHIQSFRIGVQVKQCKTNVGKDVLDGMPTEAHKQNIQKLMLVSASDFRPSTIESARRMEEREWILGIVFWNNLLLRQELARNPLVLKKYFYIDLLEPLRDLMKAWEQDSEKKIDRIIDHIKSSCGLPYLSIYDLLEYDYLHLVKDKVTASSLLLGQPPEPIKILESYTDIDKQKRKIDYDLISLQATKLNDGRFSYSFYENLKHCVVIGRKLNIKNISQNLCHLHDSVNYITLLKLAKPFIFKFVRSDVDWSKSHRNERNEYTWMIPQFIDDVKKIEKYIKVTGMTVNGIHMRLINKSIDCKNVKIEMYAKKLKTLEGNKISVRYKVETVFPEDGRSIFSSLHAPAKSYRFTLENRRGFSTKPVIRQLISNLSEHREYYDLSSDIQSVSFEADGLVQQGTGIVITW